MNITGLTSAEVQEFIRENEKNDLTKLLLSGKPVNGVSMPILVDQIRSRNKAKSKLSSWCLQDGVVFPPPLSLEQSSSETTGRYKAKILSGKRLIDLTGGMGVDISFFSKVFEEVSYVERQNNLVDTFKYNCKILGIENVTCINGDGIYTIKNVAEDHFDTIYIDPARRDQDDRKVFAIDSCEPDVVQFQSLFIKKAKTVLVKLSPMLDITHSLNYLKSVMEVHVVAVENECKELLFLIKRGFTGEAEIKTINIEREEKQCFDFTLTAEKNTDLKTGILEEYLYEPNAAVLKAGAFKLLSGRLEIQKLDDHTHLYTSKAFVPEFPGKIYKVVRNYQAKKKVIKTNLKDQKISVKTRNFPESVASIRKKYNLKDGNDKYVFFCQVAGKKTVIECIKHNVIPS